MVLSHLNYRGLNAHAIWWAMTCCKRFWSIFSESSIVQMGYWYIGEARQCHKIKFWNAVPLTSWLVFLSPVFSDVAFFYYQRALLSMVDGLGFCFWAWHYHFCLPHPLVHIIQYSSLTVTRPISLYGSYAFNLYNIIIKNILLSLLLLHYQSFLPIFCIW